MTGSSGDTKLGLPSDLAGGFGQRFPQFLFLCPYCPCGEFCVRWVEKPNLWNRCEAQLTMISCLQICFLHVQKKDYPTDRSHPTIPLRMMLEGFHMVGCSVTHLYCWPCNGRHEACENRVNKEAVHCILVHLEVR